MNWIKEKWLIYYGLHPRKNMFLFGALLLGILGLLLLLNPTYFWTITTLLLLQLMGSLFTPILRAEFATLMLITKPIGTVTSYILIGLVFYFIITPIRLFRSKKYKVGWVDSVQEIDKKKLNE